MKRKPSRVSSLLYTIPKIILYRLIQSAQGHPNLTLCYIRLIYTAWWPLPSPQFKTRPSSFLLLLSRAIGQALHATRYTPGSFRRQKTVYHIYRHTCSPPVQTKTSNSIVRHKSSAAAKLLHLHRVCVYTNSRASLSSASNREPQRASVHNFFSARFKIAWKFSLTTARRLCVRTAISTERESSNFANQQRGRIFFSPATRLLSLSLRYNLDLTSLPNFPDSRINLPKERREQEQEERERTSGSERASKIKRAGVGEIAQR